MSSLAFASADLYARERGRVFARPDRALDVRLLRGDGALDRALLVFFRFLLIGFDTRYFFFRRRHGALCVAFVDEQQERAQREDQENDAHG